jgi:hypothetical protein
VHLLCSYFSLHVRRWFKPTVRILKNMRNRMIDKNMIEESLAPS